MAEYIHRESRRANRHMMRLDCSIFSLNLVESELFGHEEVLSPELTTRSMNGNLPSAFMNTTSDQSLLSILLQLWLIPKGK